MKVDNYSNRKDRRLAQKIHKEKIFGLNKPYVAPRVIVHRSVTPTTKAVILRREDKPHRQEIIGLEKINNEKDTTNTN